MNSLQNDIPLLLREKLGEELVENIQGYYYSVSYETTDWDFPIDNTHYDEERLTTDGTNISHRGFLDYYLRNGCHNSLMLTVNSAYIDIYFSNGRSVRIEEKDSLSIAYGAFEGLRSWLEERFKKTDTQHSDTSQKYRFLTKEDIDAKLSFLESLGDTTPIREELLAGIEDCYIWKEVWTRETGHQWDEYTLLKRKPSEDEYDYADTWNFSPIQLGNFTTETIINMLKAYKK